LKEDAEKYLKKLEKRFSRFNEVISRLKKGCQPTIIDDKAIERVNKTLTENFHRTMEKTFQDQEEYLKALKEKNDSSVPPKRSRKRKNFVEFNGTAVSSDTAGAAASAGGGGGKPRSSQKGGANGAGVVRINWPTLFCDI
jgi:hypothetical protein